MWRTHILVILLIGLFGSSMPALGETGSWKADEAKKKSMTSVSKKARTDPMTANELIAIMTDFLKKDFARANAEALFGPVSDDSAPETVLLQPKADFLDRVLLHFVKVGEVNFLGMMSLVWKQPAPIDLGVLTRVYGESRELPRLHPTAPKQHSFNVKGKDYSGQLLVGVVSGTGDNRYIRDVQFRRNPPGW